MTKEEARKAAEVMLAYADGKEIEFYSSLGVWRSCDDPFFNWDGCADDYRIKPEPQYRPFNSAEECWQEMQRHLPFGWVKDKRDGMYATVSCVKPADGERTMRVGFCDGEGEVLEYGADGMLDYFTFADGTPFGVKEGA